MPDWLSKFTSRWTPLFVRRAVWNRRSKLDDGWVAELERDKAADELYREHRLCGAWVLADDAPTYVQAKFEERTSSRINIGQVRLLYVGFPGSQDSAFTWTSEFDRRDVHLPVQFPRL
jgi:hypothetical protein